MKTLSSRSSAKTSQHKRYFTGLPCKHGHISDRLTSNGSCIECTKIRSTEWAAANRAKISVSVRRRTALNPEQKIAQDAKYYLAHRQAIGIRVAEYRLKNKAKAAEWSKSYSLRHKDRCKLARIRWVKRNPEAHKQAQSEWVARNKEKCLDRLRAWRTLNPGAYLAQRQTRRARKMGAAGVISKFLREKLKKLQRGRCTCCGLPLGMDFHMDHIIPLALGGSNMDSNIQLLRKKCNLQKNAKDPIVFMQSRGFLL